MGKSAAVSSSSSRGASASGDDGDRGLGIDGDDAILVLFLNVVMFYTFMPFELREVGSERS